MKNRLHTPTILALLALSALTASANLIRNPSFEDIPSPPATQLGQGLMPSEWITVNSTPDTESSDGSYGLQGANFLAGTVAQDGLRWVAGWSYVPESFGQTLSSTLTPNDSYTLSGYLLQASRSDLVYPGGYNIYLAASADFGAARTLLGVLEPATSQTSWVEISLTFTAPVNAGSLPFLLFEAEGHNSTYDPFIGAYTEYAYAGLDNVDLSLAAVPESSTYIAGILLLLPFGVQVMRRLRGGMLVS